MLRVMIDFKFMKKLRMKGSNGYLDILLVKNREEIVIKDLLEIWINNIFGFINMVVIMLDNEDIKWIW